SIFHSGAVERVRDNLYSTIDIYGVKTEYPEIRSNIENLLASKPRDQFIEFAYFIIGDYSNAVAVNPKSVIIDTLRYGNGFKILESMLADALRAVDRRIVSNKRDDAAVDELKSLLHDAPDVGVDSPLRYLNVNSAIYEKKP